MPSTVKGADSMTSVAEWAVALYSKDRRSGRHLKRSGKRNVDIKFTGAAAERWRSQYKTELDGGLWPAPLGLGEVTNSTVWGRFHIICIMRAIHRPTFCTRASSHHQSLWHAWWILSTSTLRPAQLSSVQFRNWLLSGLRYKELGQPRNMMKINKASQMTANDVASDRTSQKVMTWHTLSVQWSVLWCGWAVPELLGWLQLLWWDASLGHHAPGLSQCVFVLQQQKSALTSWNTSWLMNVTFSD